VPKTFFFWGLFLWWKRNFFPFFFFFFFFFKPILYGLEAVGGKRHVGGKKGRCRCVVAFLWFDLTLICCCEPMNKRSSFKMFFFLPHSNSAYTKFSANFHQKLERKFLLPLFFLYCKNAKIKIFSLCEKETQSVLFNYIFLLDKKVFIIILCL